MRKLTCEMCGGTDLIKQDGVFVCQTCGTKYSVEEAKKMMIEGKVDVSGSTVKVDNSASIANYFKLAESAYGSDNQKEAENYCNKIIEIEPENYKAWLLKGKAAGWQSTLANVRIEETVNCFTKALDCAPDKEKNKIKKEASKEIEKLSSALISLSCSHFEEFVSDSNTSSILDNLKLAQLYSIVLLDKCGVSADGFKKEIATRINNAAMNAWNDSIYPDYTEDDHPSKYQWERLIEDGDCVLLLLSAAIDLYDDDNDEDIIRYKNMIDVQTQLINSWSYTYENGMYVKEYSLTSEAKSRRIDKIMEWHNKIKEIDSSYEIPERPVPKSGCFIATAVYGSYNCPEVWTLRRYRDFCLAQTWYGRAFIHTYYFVSPTIVKWFGHTMLFKRIWKKVLDKFTIYLQEKGYKSTPYNDRKW